MNSDSTAGGLRHFEDGPVRGFLLAMAFWAVAAALGGFVMALLLVMPKLFYELGESAQHLSFGRLFPTQLQVMTYGLLGNGFFAFVYYAIQRLENTPLALRPLASVHWLAWQIIIVASIVTSVRLETQGRWMGWMQWPLDIASIGVWWLLFTPVVAFTLSRRADRGRLSPPLWFALAVVLAVPCLQLINNLVIWRGEDVGSTAYVGVQDMMIQWWTGRGAASFWFTVPAVAVLYYLVARFSSGKLFSYRLTVLHFWSIALLGCWGGNFQWHLTAVPEWAGSLAMFAGLLLWLGCLAGAYNLWRSLPRSIPRGDRPVALRLASAAVVCYAIYSLDSLYMSLRFSTASTQFTDWATANQSLALFGVSGLAFLAFTLALAPSLYRVEEGRGRGNWVRWLVVEATALQVIALYVAGQVQAFSWNDLNELGRLEYMEFVNALGWVRPLWWVAAVGAALWLIGTLGWFALVVRMALAGAAEPQVIASRASSASDPTVLPSVLEGAPVLGLAVGFERWVQLGWHASLERNRGRLVRRIGVGLAVGIALIWLPSLLYRGSSADAASVTQGPYTELELMGREIYIREGCASCHTQAVRPLVPEVLRYGDLSRGSDYVEDRPTQLGFRRVGPDLAKVGGRKTSLWHWNHLENPQNVTPSSVMPAFDHLLSEPLESEGNAQIERQSQLIAAEIVGEGGPVLFGDRMVMNSRAIALIAYLQRLGVMGTVNE